MNFPPDGNKFSQWWSRSRDHLGSWTSSLALHAVLLLLLAMIVLPSRPLETTDLRLTTEVAGQPDLVPIDVLQLHPRPGEAELEDPRVDLLIPTDRIDDEASQVTLNVSPTEVTWHLEAEEFLGAVHPNGDLAGRSEQARKLLTKAFGGSDASEAAVAGGLQWLKRHQQADGSWNFEHHTSACDRTCTAPGHLNGATVAATSLALLCYVGAGHTHESGDYQPQVAQGLAYLKKVFDAAPSPGDMRQIPGTSGMYAQGLATMLLCELFGLTRDRDVGTMAQACVDFVVQAQHPIMGGWRYAPRAEVGDTSVAGWEVMALVSARMSRLTVPARSRELAGRFLDSVQMGRGAFYGYTRPEQKASTTAIGLLCRMYLGWNHARPALKNGVAYLAGIGPSRDNMYYNYYATQVLHHWGGEEWNRWNKKMRDQLVTTQVTNGHSAGSWAPRDPHSGQGGRHYMTCLAILTLEVYYRHLPLYQRRAIEVPP